MKVYNDQLRTVKFTRASVIVHKSNSQREKQINIAVLNRRDSNHERNKEEKEKRELSQSIPLLKKSDSTYLKKRFQLNAYKGIDKVRTKKLFGTKKDVELQTLQILKVNKKRFNASVEKRNEFVAGNYLSNMIANKEVDIQQELFTKMK